MSLRSTSPRFLPRRWVWVILLLLGGLMLWPRLQDLPRWAVARWLAGQVDGEVSLETLRIESRHHVVLRGLSVTNPGILPEVERASAVEVEVEAGLWQLLDGHLEVLRLRGLELWLRPAPPTLLDAPPRTPTVDLLDLGPARITVTAVDGVETTLTVQAQARNVGSDFLTATGRATVTAEIAAEALRVEPLAALGRVSLPADFKATLRDFKVELGNEATGAELHLQASAFRADFADEHVEGEDLEIKLHHRDQRLRGQLGAMVLRGHLAGHSLKISSPSASLTADPREGDPLLDLVVEPQIPGLGTARLAALVHPEERGWRELELTLDDTRWQALIPTLGFEVESALHLVDDGQSLSFDLEVRSPRVLDPEMELDLEDARFTFSGRTPHPPSLDVLPTVFEVSSAALELGAGRLGDHVLPRSIEAAGTIRAAPAWPSLEAVLRFAPLELFSGQPYPLKLAGLRLDLASPEATDLSQLHLRELETRGEVIDRSRLSTVPFTLRAAGRMLPKNGLVCESARLELPDLLVLEGSGQWQSTEGGRADLELSGLDVARWQSLLASSDLGFAFSGQATARVEARLDPAGAWPLKGPVRLRQAGFTSADSSRVMEGLSSDLDLLVTGTKATPELLTARGDAGGFVLLWGTLFGDFVDLSSQLEVEATAGADLTHWNVETRLQLPKILDLQADVGRSPAGPEGELQYAVTLSAPALQTVSQSLLARFDGLPTPEIAGHLVFQATGRYLTPEVWSASGGLTLTDLNWLGREALVEGLDLHVPLAMERRGQTISGDRQQGHLRFRRLEVRELEVPPITSALWVEADSLGLLEPLEVPVFGGRIVLHDVGASNLLGGDRFAESGLRLVDLDLGRLAADLGLFPLEGTIAGDFPRMVLRDDTLVIDGGGQVALFGGTVEVRDIRGQDLFSPFPEITLSAALRDLDLGSLTRRIDFGEMTGVLQGEIADCRLFRGVPVTCQANFRTVERRGVSRTVDIKAVNNLTILGTGQSTSVLDRGVQRFLKRFTYAALGVDVHLADDVLRLRGLEHRGERELFLRGRLPFPIDIVNAQPGGAVSFQAMLRRLKNLDISQAETSPPP